MTTDSRTNEPNQNETKSGQAFCFTEAQWKPVLGYEGLYEVSNQGRVRAVGAVEDLTQTKSKYWRVWLNSGVGRGKGANVHALVLNAFVGERSHGQVARHLNDDKDDNRLVNLAWGSVADNNRDTVRNGNHNEANKTHCPKGHAYEGSNLVIDTKGHRRCRECDLIRQRERYARAALVAAAGAGKEKNE